MKKHSTYANSISIKSWAEEDRPREKLLLKGQKQLSNAELLAIILGSGNREESALALAQRILKFHDNNLETFSKSGFENLKKFKGIGDAKAINIIAALELGTRRMAVAPKKLKQILTSQDAFEVLNQTFIHLDTEEFWILLLNRANKVIGKKQISSGGVSGTVVDAKVVFKEAIEQLASSIILSHNHPSGNLKPSQADLDLTKKLKAAGKTMDIAVLDHLILTDKGYFSFADEGFL
jgi:DNA repair protein RadC